ncbi:MAG: arginine--tRNA ligase [Candidatus Yanofskybacteria bacterium RIFCSPHIGHO2_01_FULL_45_42]|uniref:Arginine--tRNA ligase n=3 Tax=Candidatus Yanofskyibacteriota TaxID=1752733 RepID=A0A1F8H4V3_9BACT|nr:MAG: arginine--tRNA ligase [Candidatus Yanofskybacteria bacterium RIFCSPHIGHO2_01_FULL_45_42]OGN15510.1 MAG: arginine--tRNA ligase [Candidatus Yanofskybacteria bacterium RIFCSPHIGHO2_02_FULL_46_19]OGN27217.1 MAG: arginine--tRNA ligase [Candidatus Yanofskybacteria bacterium RIFCSPLOWO2_01_FULL_45_72]OGN31879.1 MAG: arginine--tRNA ligase [Candidatus Yanofskybacteria bacterium RIFCSPLOWO2_02_FULL_45_18]
MHKQAEAREQVKNIAAKIQTDAEKRDYVHLHDYLLEKVSSEVRDIVRESLGISREAADHMVIEIAPPHVHGDLALNIFDAAKISGQSAVNLAAAISKALELKLPEHLEKIELAGPFVNLFLKRKLFYRESLTEAVRLGEKFGESNVNAGKLAWVEYSAPNIAKPIGVGHLRSTIIGQALVNIYHATGYGVLRHNYLGDWGTQFGKLIYAYQQWGDENKINQNPIAELKELYVRFHKEAETNPDMEDKACALSLRLEEGAPELLSLWQRFKDLSVANFKKTYQKLGVEFDLWLGESEFAGQGQDIAKECLDKKICQKDPDSGAVVCDLGGGIPTFLIQKQDGSTLYITRDLASIKFRVEAARPDVLLYIVGSEQELNFRQFLGLAEKLGYVQLGRAKHIGFGTILSEGKKMSTRGGTLIELEELIAQSIAKSKEIIKEKNPDLNSAQADEISRIVGVGAIIYNDLRQSRTKNISFNWKRMLDFESGSAAYLQYTYVRIRSILKRATSRPSGQATGFSYIFEKESEFNLTRKMVFFPQVVLKAQENNWPHLVATYLEELAQLFNTFYNEASIINTSDILLRESRLNLISAVAAIVKKGLGLLDIKVPDKM